MDAHEVLVKARNLIEREGWISIGQPSASGPDAHCASNAIIGTAPTGAVASDAHRALLGAAGVRSSIPLSGVWRWNDAPGRTKEEVLAAFDEAIRRTAPPPADPFEGESYKDYCERQQRKWDEAVR